MNNRSIYLGETIIQSAKSEISGQFVEIENEKFYKISNYNQMPDFFMSIVSDSDHWMFLSSNGSLSAGRKNRNNALFPYYTDDKIHDYRDLTGSKTWCLVEKNNKTFLWEPFSVESEKIYNITRNLYKSIYGNKIIFEEINSDLGISFKYGWYNSEKFGWIKKSLLSNLDNTSIKIDVLDGLRNLIPYGVDYAFQNEYSNLLDAYKKNELIEETGLGMFMLSSIPIDRPEPSEALKTTTVWSLVPGKKVNICISDKQVENFKKGIPVNTEIDVRASRGAYYICTQLELLKNTNQEWYLAAEVNQDSRNVANLNKFLKSQKNIKQLIQEDIALGTSNLVRIVSKADGLQMGNDELCFARHFSNTLFNIMRGGVFVNNYSIDIDDFVLFLHQTNRPIENQIGSQINQLPKSIQYTDLLNWAKQQTNPELERICYEYLPLTFSRRHGDPSRPWNQFSIETKNSDGSDKLNYQGNWRDIFQNWEALGLSYPEYFEGMTSKFLNATTADGYNPYRITREGIDWESPDPHDPWAYIGYWGDHQIIYLQKLLEQSNAFHPGKLDEFMSREFFVYANVPYRIKSFEEMVKNPKETIDFDFSVNDEIKELTKQIGADGKLLRNKQGELYRANLTEKILITLLAKLSNFIPEAGIWLNTQRPEWNDANNALVGQGVSMVTLYYLRRFLKFWEERFNETSHEKINVSEEISAHFEKTFSLFAKNTSILEKGFSDEDRFVFTSYLGKAGAEYRNSIYAHSFSGKKTEIEVNKLKEFTQVVLNYVDQSISANKREDRLYHAYNLVSFKANRISIRYLYEMLEGQVAVLSSGYLSTEESLDVLNALKRSKMFRQDQFSYLLYPDRQLPLFVEKNNIPKERVKNSVLLQKLLAENNVSILNEDETGNYHFNGTFRNAAVLSDALDKLDNKIYGDLVAKEKDLVLDIYETIFDHQSFTGRSGTFYGHEGLGSIYWHMVSKLLLATQECYFKGVQEGADAVVIGKLKDHYFEIKAGIGLYKSPEIYGAFPTDPYSHTPANSGVKQPGLTGQVKEDVISRFGELGIHIKHGKITFGHSLLNPDEILKQNELFSYFDLSGNRKTIELSENQLAFTFCQVPVIYNFKEKEQIKIVFSNGDIKEIQGNEISQELTSKIFARTGEIEKIEYQIKT